MSDNLGDFASLLGEGFSQAAQYDERDRRRAEKRAMKDKLLYAFAAPLVSAAGKGIVDFAGDVALGKNSRNFFEREEGASLRNRLNSMSNEFDQFDSMHTVYLKAGGGDVKNGMRETLLESKQRNMKQYEGDPLYEATQGMSYILTPEEEQKLDLDYNEFMSSYNDLRVAKDLTGEELARRFGDTRIGKGKARRLVAKIAAALNPNLDYERDVVGGAIDRMLTGGDSSIRDTEFYKAAVSSDYFKEAFKNKIAEARDIGIYTSSDDLLANTLESITSGQEPELDGIKGQLNQNVQRRISVAQESSRIKNLAQNRPFVQRLVSQLERDNKALNMTNLSEVAVEKIGLVDDTEQFINNWMSREENSPIVENFRNQVAMARYRKDSYDQLKEASKAKVNESVARRFEETVQIFNNEVSLVLTDVMDRGDFSFDESNISPRSIQGLAARYLSTALDPAGDHLVQKSYNYEDASLITKGLNMFDTQIRHTGTFANTEKLTQMIENHLINKSVSMSDSQSATDQGLGANMRRRSSGIDEEATLGRVEKAMIDISRDTSLTLAERNSRMAQIANEVNNETGNVLDDRLRSLIEQYNFVTFDR